MNWATAVLVFLAGVILGGFVFSLIVSFRSRVRQTQLETRAGSAEAVVQELRGQCQQNQGESEHLRHELTMERQLRIQAVTQCETLDQRLKEEMERFDAIRKELSETFKALSLDALSKNTDQFKVYADDFMKLAEEKLKAQNSDGKKELESKKELIDKNIESIGKTLAEVQRRIEDVGKVSGEKIAEVNVLIRKHEEVTIRLKDTTENLGRALASSKKRGEWGERMAEDIIALVGMVEGINYSKQKTLETAPGRPDFTFFLPNNLRVNMDVKFPLDNFTNYVDAQNDTDRKRFRDELLKNTKSMIKQVTGREYINPAENTVDYVIIFIPNEQVYGFIQESDTTIMDEALKQKVILCSPFTLYAVLAVIRQTIENFTLERTASEILQLLADFSKQWKLFKDKFKVMGDRLDAAKKEYDILATTRTKMLERPLRKIDEISAQELEQIDTRELVQDEA
ncbi:MAG: DNA recombination protein RmuC [Syntrophorhabdaceae bacterium]